MNKLILSFAWRLVRAAAGLGLAQLIATLSNNPQLLWLAPIITALAKALREKFNLTNLPL
jgi:hypothetical protein